MTRRSTACWPAQGSHCCSASGCRQHVLPASWSSIFSNTWWNFPAQLPKKNFLKSGLHSEAESTVKGIFKACVEGMCGLQDTGLQNDWLRLRYTVHGYDVRVLMLHWLTAQEETRKPSVGKALPVARPPQQSTRYSRRPHGACWAWARLAERACNAVSGMPATASVPTTMLSPAVPRRLSCPSSYYKLHGWVQHLHWPHVLGNLLSLIRTCHQRLLQPVGPYSG